MSESSTELRFGNACLQPEQRRLLIDGKPARLGARAFDVLAVLAARRDRVVGKHELFEQVWPGVIVEENNLQVQISTLRKLLGPQVIATIPGRGYQFAAAVETESGTAVDAAVRAPSSPPTSTDAPRVFGRSADVDAVRALLRENRLVSIVGAGGIGKTVVARVVANDAADDYRDGVCWVELASLSDASLIDGAVAQAVAITLSGERSARQALLGVLRDKELLLVLDNCEHLIDAVAPFADAVLAGARELTLLTTSQETLRSPHEVAYRLSTLAVDADDEGRLGGAVELFLSRARAADPRIDFDAAAMTAVGDICRRLDGMPLAIELAAARVPLLGVEGLRDRLGERFRILTGGARTVLRRHQTLRAALDWSHGLLDAEEQVVFRRLGVFSGGFPLELAQDVVADTALDRWTVLELLGHLVDKSLVVAEGASVPRYRLLETTRTYALEQLAAAGETAALLQIHARAVARFFASHFPSRWTQTMAQRAALGAEIDNLRAALDWALEADAALACELAAYGYVAWISRGLQNEGIEACLRVLPSMPPLARADEARFRLAAGRLGYIGGRRECFEGAKRAAELFNSGTEAAERIDALCVIAQIGSRRGERDIVAAAVADATRLLPPDAPRRQAASVAVAEAQWHQMCGRYAEWKACVQRQAALYRANGDEFGFWLAESNTGFAECGLDEFDPAIRRLQRSLDELRRMNAPYGTGQALGFLTIAHAMRGDVASAIECGRESVAELARHGWQGWMLHGVALAHAKGGASLRAALLLGFLDGEYERLGLVRRALEERWVEEIADRTTHALGDAEVDRLRNEGRALAEQRALALAFDEVEIA